MKRHLYLLGGTGNVLFQIMKIHSVCGDKFYVCDMFITDFFRRVFSHTIHKNEYRDIVQVPGVSYFSLPILIFDLILARLFRVSFFSVFDLNFVKTYREPIFFDLIYFGYFQQNIDISKIYENRHIVKSHGDLHQVLVAHVRGGDFEGSENVFTKKMGAQYYIRCLERLKLPVDEVLVVTNDSEYAKTLFLSIGMSFEFTKSKTALEDFYIMGSSRYVICSNSTFSFLGCLLGGEVEVMCVPDFFKEKFFGFDNLPFKTEFVKVDD